MKLKNHLVAAIPLVAGVYLSTGSWTAAGLAFASSVLIDVDHLPDYVYVRRGWHGFRDFFETCHNQGLVKTSLVLHAWEWVILCGALWLAGVHPEVTLPIGLGVAYHLILDTRTNPVIPRFYWMTCRGLHGFAFAPFFRRQPSERAIPSGDSTGTPSRREFTGRSGQP